MRHEEEKKKVESLMLYTWNYYNGYTWITRQWNIKKKENPEKKDIRMGKEKMELPLLILDDSISRLTSIYILYIRINKSI